jgi:hypothetical protein
MKFSRIAAALAAMSVSPAYAHCGGAFCAMNTDWNVQGVWEKPGVRLDLRAEFIDLDQLRHGNDKNTAQGVVDTHDEVRTLNRNYSATLDWSIDDAWGLTLRVPMVDRDHTHVHNLDDGAGGVEPERESWKFTQLGDIQAVARYSFYRDGQSTAGVRFGLKLPTGSQSEKNSAGETAERSLQPGTGSTDGIVGVYYNRRLGDFSWFAQGTLQRVLHERNDFRPGYQLGADVGVNYRLGERWSLLLQLNAQHKGRDHGANAEPEDSGATYFYLNPGVSYRLNRTTQLYGFFQQPLYQHVRGTQLTADWAASLGVGMQF